MANAVQNDLTGAQLMTLSAIGATAATPRPSGETLQGQAQRMMRGIWTHLNDPSLDTGGTWQALWLGLSPDNANMAYIARNVDGSNQFAVVVRGTVDGPTDMMEDLDVGSVVPFTAAGSADPVAVSAGAMAAFTQVVNASGAAGTPAGTESGGGSGEPGLPILSGTTLTNSLGVLLSVAPATPTPTVYVTGHSLGGAVATMLATYLQAQHWAPITPQFALVTFAAPTAGLDSFAQYVDGRPWSLYATYANTYDVVPRAWWDLEEAKEWYKLGPKANERVKFMLTEIAKLPKNNVYVQPNSADTVMLNPNYTHDPRYVHKTTSDYLAQLAFQHANNTYLALMGANPVPTGPVVTAVSPTCGGSGTPVLITGTGFTSDSVVDFGPIVCGRFTVDPSGETITATAPAGLGIVDIRVTNDLGTSPAVPLGTFAYGTTAPLVVSAVTPSEESDGKQVTISGSGFVKGTTTVQFGDVAAEPVDVDGSLTEITTYVPKKASDAVPQEQQELGPTTVDVTVTIGEITSPTSAADEFTYPL